jgi:hypothetical protein
VTYAEGLEIVDREGIAKEVEEGILQHAAVAIAEKQKPSQSAKTSGRFELPMDIDSREHEAITVQPLGVFGVELHELVEEDVGNGSHTPGEPVSTSSREQHTEVGVDVRTRGSITYMGAPGCPELLVNVASTWTRHCVSPLGDFQLQRRSVEADKARVGKIRRAWRGIVTRGRRQKLATYREKADGVDGQLINVGGTHDC